MASRAAEAGAAHQATIPGRKTGRRASLDRPVPLHANVLPQGEAIARLIRTGLPIKDAAIALGLSHDAAYRCLGDGRIVAGLIWEGRLDPADLTPFQQQALAYYEVVDRAEMEAIALHTSAIAKHAQGGNVRKTTETTYDADGKITGTKVREEIIPSDLKASTFFVERRRPDLFGRTEHREISLVSGETAAPTASPLDRLASALEEIERRRNEGARVIEAHVVDDAETA